MKLEKFKDLLLDAHERNISLNSFIDEVGLNATAIRVNRYRLRNEKGIDIPALPYIQKSNNNHTKFIITSITKGVLHNDKLLKSLENLASDKNAKLIIAQIDYTYDKHENWFDYKLDKYYIDGDCHLNGNTVITSIPVNPSIKYPLSAFRDIYHGLNVIVPFPAMHYETRPAMLGETVNHITTTMSIADVIYKDNKGGNIAKNKTKLGAIYLDGHKSTQLEFDGDGVCLYGDYYTKDGKSKMNASAVVFGDSHLARELDIITDKRTVLCELLNPEYLCHHDIYDHQSESHHLTTRSRISNFINDTDDVESELSYVGYYLRENFSKYKNVIVGSNHNDHLDRWLNEYNPRGNNVKNNKIYHHLWHLILDREEYQKLGALQIWLKEKFNDVKCIFPSRNERFLINDIDVAHHGDVGVNGSRGATQFIKHGIKSVVGHTHSPLIANDTWWVGCSNRSASYAKGYSTWDICDVIIYENGTRQYIFYDVVAYNSGE